LIAVGELNMPEEKKTCFVIMGFGKKTDYKTGRTLDLDASYRSMIKPAVEEAGLECIRADEIVHSGVIDVPMYQQILKADVVVADLSTGNGNAFYELGVRHAMRPYTTIIIAEDQFVYPFDVNHTVIRMYKHLGDDIGFTEVMRFRDVLKKAIKEISDKPTTDSPVYTYLNDLNPPGFEKHVRDVAAASAGVASAAGAAAPKANDPTLGVLMEQARAAQGRGEFMAAKGMLAAIREMMKPKGSDDPRQEDPYIIQQLALVTYKSKLPSPQAALEEARSILKGLNPATSNDTETLGLWGAVHKRLWDLTRDRAYLNEAVRAYERGFYLRNDYYNGINLAFILNARADHTAGRAEAIADFVQAERVRREVLEICEEEVKAGGLPDDKKYWVMGTMAEALLGTGDEDGARRKLEEGAALKPAKWMIESTQEQMEKLRDLLSRSPLKYVKNDGD
jgi:hypothetical protein